MPLTMVVSPLLTAEETRQLGEAIHRTTPGLLEGATAEQRAIIQENDRRVSEAVAACLDLLHRLEGA